MIEIKALSQQDIGTFLLILEIVRTRFQCPGNNPRLYWAGYAQGQGLDSLTKKGYRILWRDVVHILMSRWRDFDLAHTVLWVMFGER